MKWKLKFAGFFVLVALLFSSGAWAGQVGVTGITLSLSTLSLDSRVGSPDHTGSLIATVVPSGAKSKITWMTDSSDIATVSSTTGNAQVTSSTATVTAVSKGTTTITVTATGYQAKCVVSVDGGGTEPDPDPIDETKLETLLNSSKNYTNSDDVTFLTSSDVLVIFEYEEKLEKLLSDDQLKILVVPVMSQDNKPVVISADGGEDAGLITNLTATITSGSPPPTDTGEITPVLAQLTSADSGGQKVARIEISLPDDQRGAITRASALFSMTFAVGVKSSDLSIYYTNIEDVEENLFKAGKASRDMDAGGDTGVITIRVSNNPNVTDAMTFNELFGTIFTISNDAPVAVTGVSLDVPTMPLSVNETGTLTATVRPLFATSRDVTWASSSEDVATVSADANNKAVVKGIATGNSTITVSTDDGGYEDYCTVTVSTGGGSDPGPDPEPTDHVKPEEVWQAVEDGKKAIEENDVRTKNSTEIAALFDENPSLKDLLRNGHIEIIVVPDMGTAPGTVQKVTIIVHTAQAANLMTKLIAEIGEGTLPTLNGIINPLIVQLKHLMGVDGKPFARFDISIPDAQRSALAAAGNAGNIFTMTFTVQLTGANGSNVYMGKENLARTGKAAKDGSNVKIKVSNDPGARNAIRFNELFGTIFTVKLDSTAKAEALANIKAGDYNIHDLHNALLLRLDDANWSKYKTDIDKLPTEQKDNETELQRVIDRVNAGILVTGVILNKSSLPLKVTESETLIATVAPANAGNKLVKWSTSEAKFATVDNGGKVTAVANGTATITAMTDDGNFTAKCVVEVTGDPDPKKGGGGCTAAPSVMGYAFLAFALLPILLKGKKK